MAPAGYSFRSCVQSKSSTGKSSWLVTCSLLQREANAEPSDFDSAAMKCVRALFVEGHDSQRQQIPPRLSGTCIWFLESQQCMTWKNEAMSSLLWVSADPGCGKSVLASFLIDDLKSEEPQRNLLSTICYFFCKTDDERRNSGVLVVRSLLHQLLCARTDLLQYADEIYKKKGSAMLNDLEVLWDFLVELASKDRRRHVVCIIDALDECLLFSGKCSSSWLPISPAEILN